VTIRVIRVEPSCNSCLRLEHGNEMAQLVFYISGHGHGLGDLVV